MAAIEGFGADLGLDLRAALNPPTGSNLARELHPGPDLTADEAYALLVDSGLAPARLTVADGRTALVAHIENGAVAGVALADLADQAARDSAHTALESAGLVPQAATDDEATAALAALRFYEFYAETDPDLTAAARTALQRIGVKVAGMQVADLALDVLSISYIRIAIFGLALLFFMYLMKRSRLGLEVRAVTQNRGMAASMGINPDRINRLTIGLGSGIAGIAGVAIGLFAKGTSELGADYIVQSFMTVVVGNVGNI